MRNVEENLKVNYCFGSNMKERFPNLVVDCKSFYVPEGYYESPEELSDLVAKGVNLGAKKYDHKPILFTAGARDEFELDINMDDEKMLTQPELIFDFNHNMQQMSVKVEMMPFIIFSDSNKLFELLGVPSVEKTRETKNQYELYLAAGETKKAPREMKPSLKTYQSMKVYIDCIEQTVVANLLTHEIGTVTLPSGTRGQTLFVFPNLNYVPLNKNHIETIKMECFDQYGDPFPIHGGHVHATFLFRRQSA